MSIAKTTDNDRQPRLHRSATETNFISIGEMARRFSVSLRTLRFYEDRGLLAPRRIGNTRLYSEADVLRLESILGCKQLGFTLNEIRTMIADTRKDPASGRFKPREEQIKAQIAFLERQRTGIDDALSALRREQRRLATA
jgi:DNA-binding transcriptional MerR regulator